MAEADLMPITKILITFYKHNLCQEGYIYCPWPTYTILTIVQPSLQQSQLSTCKIPLLIADRAKRCQWINKDLSSFSYQQPQYASV